MNAKECLMINGYANIGFTVNDKIWHAIPKNEDEPYFDDENMVKATNVTDVTDWRYFNINEIGEACVLDKFGTPLKVGDYVLKIFHLQRYTTLIRARITNIKYGNKIASISLDYFPTIEQLIYTFPNKNQSCTLISHNFPVTIKEQK